MLQTLCTYCFSASVAGYSGWKTGVFDKSILCHHLIAFFSCLPESYFSPNISVCPRPLPVVSLCRLGPAPSRLRVSGSYPPPSHSRHSESSLKSPRSQSSESWHPPTAAWRPAATCSWGAERCRDLQLGCICLQLLHTLDSSRCRAASRELQHSSWR